MVDEIMQAPSFCGYLADQYGNYVVQKALQVALEPKKTQFLNLLRPEMPELMATSSLGYKIYCRLIKQYPTLQPEGAEIRSGNYRGQPGFKGSS